MESPLSTQTRRRLEHASGYMMLGMKAEAAEALGEIAAEERGRRPVLRARAWVATECEAWREAAEVLAVLCEEEPEEAGHFIQFAYATRRWRGIAEARAILWRGLERHPEEPIIHFNLACYEAQLGELGAARAHLASACGLDAGCVAMAEKDEDLAPLRAARARGEVAGWGPEGGI